MLNYGEFDLTEKDLEIVDRGKNELSSAENLVVQAKAAVIALEAGIGSLKESLEKGEKALMDKRTELERHKDDLRNLEWEVKDGVSPISNGLRNHGKMYDDLRRELGIYGEASGYTVLPKPASVKVSRTKKPKKGLLDAFSSIYLDSIAWSYVGVDDDIQFEVEKGIEVTGSYRSTGSKKITFYQLTVTPETKLTNEIDTHKSDLPKAYRVKAKNGLQNSEPVIVYVDEDA